MISNFNKTMLCLMLASGIILSGCTLHKQNTKVRLQAGLNKGGIVDNTRAEDWNPGPPDAFSGATRTGFNAGARANYPLGKISIESGIDYMYNHQSFTYNDDNLQFSGTRQWQVHQLMVPVKLNIPILRNASGESVLEVNVGPVLQYNGLSKAIDTGTLPPWNLRTWSAGAALGVVFTPITLSNGSKVGLFAEVYRGSQIYEDPYNLPAFEMPGSAFGKIGLVYRLR